MLTHKRLLSVAVLVGTCLSWNSAHAQGWLADRKYTEGAGYRVGDFELHPGLGGEVGYDSNWFQRSPKDGAVNSASAFSNPGAGIFRITPSLYLSTLQAQRKEGDVNPEPPKVNFRAGISATYRAFVGSDEVIKQNGLNGLSGDLNARADILPQRPFSFGIEGLYSRTVAPNASGNPDVSFNRNNLGAGLDATVTPGSGTLNWKLGYQLRASLLDTPSAAPFNTFNNTLFTHGEWRFRPKTSVFYDANAAFTTFTQKGQSFNDLQNSTPFRTKLGFSGLLTPRFSLLVAAGWGASFVDVSSNPKVQQFDSVIGQVEAKFFLTANPMADNPNAVGLSISTLSLGFTRDFATSFLSTFYESDRGYAKVAYFFAGRALVSLEGGVAAIRYPDVYFAGGTQAVPRFTDVRADATLFGEYRFTNTLGINTTLRYTGEFSGTTLPVANAGGPALAYDMNYSRFEAYLGFRWFM
jgi:hypothetical protein